MSKDLSHINYGISKEEYEDFEKDMSKMEQYEPSEFEVNLMLLEELQDEIGKKELGPFDKSLQGVYFLDNLDFIINNFEEDIPRIDDYANTISELTGIDEEIILEACEEFDLEPVKGSIIPTLEELGEKEGRNPYLEIAHMLHEPEIIEEAYLDKGFNEMMKFRQAAGITTMLGSERKDLNHMLRDLMDEQKADTENLKDAYKKTLEGIEAEGNDKDTREVKIKTLNKQLLNSLLAQKIDSLETYDNALILDQEDGLENRTIASLGGEYSTFKSEKLALQGVMTEKDLQDFGIDPQGNDLIAKTKDMSMEEVKDLLSKAVSVEDYIPVIEVKTRNIERHADKQRANVQSVTRDPKDPRVLNDRTIPDMYAELMESRISEDVNYNMNLSSQMLMEISNEIEANYEVENKRPPLPSHMREMLNSVENGVSNPDYDFDEYD